jgi:hypothetical protein
VPAALGKAYNALSKGFAECRTRQNLHDKKKVSVKAALPSTFYRTLSKSFAGKVQNEKSQKNSKNPRASPWTDPPDLPLYVQVSG